MLFFQLINVKMLTTVGILTFLSRKNFIVELSIKKSFITLGPGSFQLKSQKYLKSQDRHCEENLGLLWSLFLFISL